MVVQGDQARFVLLAKSPFSIQISKKMLELRCLATRLRFVEVSLHIGLWLAAYESEQRLKLSKVQSNSNANSVLKINRVSQQEMKRQPEIY